MAEGITNDEIQQDVISMKNKFKILNLCLLTIGFIIQNKPVFSQNISEDSLIKEKIYFIQSKLNDAKFNADLWNYGWIAAYSVSTITEGVIWAISDEQDVKQDMILGSATCALGAAFQLISPLKIGEKARYLSQLPENTYEERLLKLSIAEDLLKSAAIKEKSGRSWKIHALTGAVNIGSGLVTYYAFKRDIWAGIGNFALNTLITEAQIWSQPIKTSKDYLAYCNKYGLPPQAYKPKPTLYFGVYPGGLGFKLLF